MVTDHNKGPNKQPYTIGLYAAPDYSVDSPLEPLPAWFRHMLTGPSGDFQILQNAVADIGDWGFAREVTRYRQLDDDITAVAIKIEEYQCNLDAAHTRLRLLRSVTMPIKNFFLSSSLAPAHSSLYLQPAYLTGTSLNCTSQNSSGTTLNCTSPVSDPTPGTALNCNFGHLSHLGNIGDLGHLGHLGHFGHLGHLSYLGNTGNLDTLDPYSLNPAPTDSLPGAFITEMDPTDPGPSEGCYADDSLDPLHARTLETAYTSQVPLRDTYTSVTIRNHAYQKLFSFVVTHPSSLLPLPPTRICDRHVIKLHIPELFPFLRIIQYNVKLHLPGLGPNAQYGAKLQLRTPRPSQPSWSPRQHR
jgi:hypothetical protein